VEQIESISPSKSRAFKLSGGTQYIVEVSDPSTGCSTDGSVIISEQQIIPLLAVSKEDNTVCDPFEITSPGLVKDFKGKIFSSISNPEGAVNYTFTRINPDASTISLTGTPGITFEFLPEAIYEVEAENLQTGCKSSRVTVQIGNGTQIPILTTGSTPSTNCIGGEIDGVAFVDFVQIGEKRTNAPPGLQQLDLNNLEFSWSGGPSTATGESTSVYSGLQGGVLNGLPISYSVSVTDRTTGCAAQANVAVADGSQKPLIADFTITPDEYCGADGSGTATISDISLKDISGNIISISGGDFNFNDFQYAWERQSGVNGPFSSFPVTPDPTINEQLTDLDKGTYRVTVTDDKTNCNGVCR
jgi:hypothetical protein